MALSAQEVAMRLHSHHNSSVDLVAVTAASILVLGFVSAIGVLLVR